MISYKFKLYRTSKTKHIDMMLREASFVWNHALAIQRRYYSIYGKYISLNSMQKHFSKRIKRRLLHSQTVQEILERLDLSYNRFFKKIASRPPKFKRAEDFTSFCYKQGGYSIDGNSVVLNTIKKKYKFSKSRDIDGKIKRLSIKRKGASYYLVVVTDSIAKPYRKTHNGASVGINFGLKTYMTLSDGLEVENPLELKKAIKELKIRSKKFSGCKKGSKNREKAKLSLIRLHESISNRRSDFQWKLAHTLCREYDYIFLEDLVLTGMTKRWGRKMSDLAHGEFVNKLIYVASKYNVTVHKVDRWFASSKTCECGYVNKSLSLSDRTWICDCCGSVNDRDLLASKNILRKGISELKSKSKTTSVAPCVCIQESHCLQA